MLELGAAAALVPLLHVRADVPAGTALAPGRHQRQGEDLAANGPVVVQVKHVGKQIPVTGLVFAESRDQSSRARAVGSGAG